MLGAFGRWITRSSERVVSRILWGGGDKTAAGPRVSDETAMQVALFHRCEEIKSATLASLPCVMYKQIEDAGKTVYERAVAHPAYKVLMHKPNDLDSPAEFFAQIVLDLDLHGNWYGLTEYAGNGKLRALWRVPPWCVRPYWITYPNRIAYEYTAPMPNEKEPEPKNAPVRKLLPGDIVHIKGMTPTNWRSEYGLRGAGLLELQRETIGLAIAARNYASEMYKNNAVPAGILQYKGNWSKDTKKEFQEEWQKSYGEGNRGKTAVVNTQIEYKPIAISPADAQMFENSQSSNTDITVITGVPPAVLGLNTGVTYSNAREQLRSFHSVTISQLAHRIAKGLEKGLLSEKSREKYEIRFDLASMMRGDDLVRAKYLETMTRIGAFSPNDVLAMEGRNPRPGGNVYTLLPGAGVQQASGESDSEPPEPSAEGGGETPPSEDVVQ